MMRTYARLRGLRRLMIPVPVLTPRLSSYWVNLISPVPAGIARPLIEGLRNEVVVRDPGPARAFGLSPLSYVEALRRAMDRTDPDDLVSTWFDALRGARQGQLSSLTATEGMIVERRQRARPRIARASCSPRSSAWAAAAAGRTRTCCGAFGA